MNEETMQERIGEITDAYAVLPQMEYSDLTLEAIGSNGDVRVTISLDGIRGHKNTIEKTIKFKDSLDFITDTFGYPNTFTPRSRDIALDGLKTAYFDVFGYLIVEREDSQEVFKVKDSHRVDIEAILRDRIGDKFNKPSKVTEEIKTPPKQREDLYKVYFTIDGKQDYFIVSGNSLQGAKNTAHDEIKRRGLNLIENNVFDEKIKT